MCRTTVESWRCRRAGSWRRAAASRATPPSEDLSWFDRTTAMRLAQDGSTLVFGEEGEAGGPLGATYTPAGR
jgi:hypothetical protein